MHSIVGFVCVYVFIIHQQLAYDSGSVLIDFDVGSVFQEILFPDDNILLQVTISKDDTVILDGSGDKKSLEERCEQV